ncbi:MAG: transcriptional repressor, partial [Eubacterium sp.]|nr:transcriptional repressor [Eubacterium sp.]
KALKKDDKIGTATVYRMVNMLEEIGAISRKNMYRISCGRCCSEGKDFIVELNDGKSFQLSDQDWKTVVWEGLKVCGYIDEQTPVEAIMRVYLASSPSGSRR